MLSLLEFDSAFYKEKQGSKYINMAEKNSKTENMSLVRDQIASHCWRNTASVHSMSHSSETWQTYITHEVA